MDGLQENIALRNWAHKSLVKATGQDLPADARAWEELLRNPAAVGTPRSAGIGERMR